MFLACDIGNTNVKFAIYENANRISFKIYPKDKIEYNQFEQFEITRTAIASVVPENTKSVSDFLQNKFQINPYILSSDSKLALAIDYKTPYTLGIDRICSAEGAYSLYSSEAPFISELENSYLLVIDFGTATTINFINCKAVFEGGIILPGIKLLINSLNTNTAQLPKIDLANYTSFIGKDTHSSIASGVLNSTISLIEKAYNHITKNLKAKVETIYLTGGNALAIQPFIPFENMLVEDLVLLGIKSIYERNMIE